MSRIEDENPDRPDFRDPSAWPNLPIHEPDEDFDAESDVEDEEEIEDQVRSVLITGANGNIGRKLREHHWNISRTAEDLKIERSHLHRKIKLLEVEMRPEI